MPACISVLLVAAVGLVVLVLVLVHNLHSYRRGWGGAAPGGGLGGEVGGGGGGGWGGGGGVGE